jgi:co-chaperonin GroES (HSP10)
LNCDIIYKKENKMTQVIPSETNILVKKNVKGATKSGIIIPDSPSTESVVEATVVAVGPGKPLDDNTFRKGLYKKGDVVLFLQSEYAKKEIDVDGEMHLLLNERDILAVVKK